MKTQSKKQLLVTSTALTGGTALAAGNGANPFTSQTTHAGSLQAAEMACGAGQCGSSMDDEKKNGKQDDES
jgi:uncharacterized low-complexity protein